MMRIAWVWRHPQTVEYLLNTHDARFETLAYLARQNHIVCVAPSDRDFQLRRSSRPISGQFDVIGLAGDYQRVGQVLTQFAPDVVVCEAGFDEPEWAAVRQWCPDAFLALYYGGGPFWDTEGTPFPMLEAWDAIFVPHEAQRQWLIPRMPEDPDAPFGPAARVVRAYGIPTNVFRPMDLPKQFHVYYPANFAAGKRNALVAQYLEQYAPLHLPSLFTGRVEDLNVLDMVRVGAVPMNNPGPPRGQPLLGARVPQVLMPIVYNLAEVVVYGSQEEGHPNAVFEAMACGTPAIVMSDCEWMVSDACWELARRYTPGIQVCDPSPEAIHAAVEAALADPVMAAQRARLAILDHYEWWPMYRAVDATLRNGLALKRAGQRVET